MIHSLIELYYLAYSYNWNSNERFKKQAHQRKRQRQSCCQSQTSSHQRTRRRSFHLHRPSTRRQEKPTTLLVLQSRRTQPKRTRTIHRWPSQFQSPRVRFRPCIRWWSLTRRSVCKYCQAISVLFSWGIQCNHFCLRTNWNRQNLHHVRLQVQSLRRWERNYPPSYRRYLQIHLRLWRLRSNYIVIKVTFMVRASYIQIYNENVSDLLRTDKKSLQIREDPKKGVYIEGVSEWAVVRPQ